MKQMHKSLGQICCFRSKGTLTWALKANCIILHQNVINNVFQSEQEIQSPRCDFTHKSFFSFWPSEKSRRRKITGLPGSNQNSNRCLTGYHIVLSYEWLGPLWFYLSLKPKALYWIDPHSTPACFLMSVYMHYVCRRKPLVGWRHCCLGNMNMLTCMSNKRPQCWTETEKAYRQAEEYLNNLFCCQIKNVLYPPRSKWF